MTKVKAKTRFYDKNDAKTLYEVGTVLEWDDEERIADCLRRGLIEIVEAEEPVMERPTPKKKKTK